jgi:hypothetical protein
VMNFLHMIEDTGFSTWVRESPSIWSFPVILLIHTLGMGFIVGVSAGIDLRILGMAPALRLAPMEKFLPILWFGFWTNAITGTMLLMADASMKLTNPDFYVKMAFIALSLINLSMIRKYVFRDPLIETGKFSSKARFLAWSSLFCWLVVITSGRLLAYVGSTSTYK